MAGYAPECWLCGVWTRFWAPGVCPSALVSVVGALCKFLLRPRWVPCWFICVWCLDGTGCGLMRVLSCLDARIVPRLEGCFFGARAALSSCVGRLAFFPWCQGVVSCFCLVALRAPLCLVRVLPFLCCWSVLAGRLSVLECAFWGFLLLHRFPLLRLLVTHIGWHFLYVCAFGGFLL